MRDLNQLEALIPLGRRQQLSGAIRRSQTGQQNSGLAELVKFHLGQQIDPHTLFDVQVKRIHEYKRQLLNLMRVIAHYNRLLDAPRRRGGATHTTSSAARRPPGYFMAKLIIRLINDVADGHRQRPSS